MATRFFKTLTFLVLAFVFSLPARARRKIGAGPAAAGPARAHVAASLPRHGGVKPPLRQANLKVSATAQDGVESATSAKPFTREQVSNMVRDGFGDDSGAKLIEQRGVDFTPSEDFIQSLKAAGASEAFLKSVLAAKPPEPAGQNKPINQVQVFALLVGQVPSHRVTMLVQERGIDFEPTDDYLQEVRLAGGGEELISALKGAKVTKPATVDPAVQARQAEVKQHAARGAEFFRAKRYDYAETEFRAAVRLNPQNASLRGALGATLASKGDLEGATAEVREAVRLDTNNDMLHGILGDVLYQRGDLDGALGEFREEVRLNPNDGSGHHNLGEMLRRKGDLDGAISELREALRIDPNDAGAHYNVGLALYQKDDWDGAITEYREALQLNPNDSDAHDNLGVALWKKGDRDGSASEYRKALRLSPTNSSAHIHLGMALQEMGDLGGAIAEYREALRLSPNNGVTHVYLGAGLAARGDLDGAIAEWREALRLDPRLARAHHLLGSALEAKGDEVGALEEYRTAFALDPKNPDYLQAYEGLLQRTNH